MTCMVLCPIYELGWMHITAKTTYRIRQSIHGIKFSPKARPLYWGKIFAKLNFANRVRSPLQEVVGGARAYRIMRMCKRLLVVYSSVSCCYHGRWQLTRQGPRRIGQISRCSAEILEDWHLDSRERELETAVSTWVVAHVLKFLIIVCEQKIQRVKIHSGRKYSTRKFSPLTSTGENFLLANFLLYTVVKWPWVKVSAVSRSIE